jgi:tRNA-(ms[2]io[6]A)-hydroxylase
MLSLVSRTDPRWIDIALNNLDAVLLDHLHCELKAASNSTALVARYPMHPRLVTSLTELAREELTHVQQVYDALALRGVTPKPPEEDPYALALRRALHDRAAEPLLDRLAVAAVIEARSCERFSLLAEHAPTAAMRAWYRELFASEARHHRLFSSLAEEIYGEARARARIEHLAEREAEIITRAEPTPRVH